MPASSPFITDRAEAELYLRRREEMIDEAVRRVGIKEVMLATGVHPNGHVSRDDICARVIENVRAEFARLQKRQSIPALSE